MKKILILAGSYFQIPVIKYAKEHGYFVITCDNRPDNPGHKIADKYINVSTTDMEGVLKIATENKIDGILAYASDPAAQTAGYVSEMLGLPGNSYDTVKTLGIKSEYRQFLKKNDFNYPNFVVLKDGEYKAGAIKELKYPLIVKPSDSAGSKGVSRVKHQEEIPAAIGKALPFSRNKEIIIEEYVQKVGPQIGGEAYAYKGKLVMMCLGDQKVNDKSEYIYVPIGMTFPAQIEKEENKLIKTELQRIISLSDFQTGALNLEIMRTAKNKIYIMEIGPRSGGNLLPELMNYTCDYNVAGLSVEHAIGNDVVSPKVFDIKEGYYAYYAIHSQKKGIFNGLEKSSLANSWIIEEQIFYDIGQEYNIFKHSGYVIGIWLLRFSSKKDMDMFFNSPCEYYNIR
ncbi:MAG: ATP-grasp domain-containing protein [Actinomycetota bacterium]